MANSLSNKQRITIVSFLAHFSVLVGFRQFEYVKNDVIVCNADGRDSYATPSVGLTTWGYYRHRLKSDYHKSNRRRNRQLFYFAVQHDLLRRIGGLVHHCNAHIQVEAYGRVQSQWVILVK